MPKLGWETWKIVAIGAALMALLGAAVAAWQLHLGASVSLAIAAAKALLLAWFFMHLDKSSPLQRLFAGVALGWLAILFGLTLGDVLTR